ncbi:MAG: outer membrane beta-barrel protein [Bacteriovoracia bacterium]
MNFGKKAGVLAVSTFLATLFVLQFNPRVARGELIFSDEAVNEEADTTKAFAQVSPEDSTSEPSDEIAAMAPKTIEEEKTESPSQIIRKQRIQEELKNEALAAEKLEELRLRDELKRREELFNSVKKEEPKKEEEIQTEHIQAEEMIEEPVSRVEKSKREEKQTVATSSSLTASTIEEEKASSDMRFTLTPRAGVSLISGSIYDIQSQSALGFDIGVDLTDYFAITGGYTYSQYGLTAGSSIYSPYGYQTSGLRELQFNDNQIDVGGRLNFTPVKSKVRPFIGAGAGYRRGYVNYDNNTQQYLSRFGQYASQDVEISGFNGNLNTGLEFRLTDHVSVTGMFKFIHMFTTSQSAPVNPNAFANQNVYYNGMYYNTAGYYAGPYNYTDNVKNQVGDALVRNNIYNVSVGLTIGF